MADQVVPAMWRRRAAARLRQDFPSLTTFERRPTVQAAALAYGPASETLHTSRLQLVSACRPRSSSPFISVHCVVVFSMRVFQDFDATPGGNHADEEVPASSPQPSDEAAYHNDPEVCGEVVAAEGIDRPDVDYGSRSRSSCQRHLQTDPDFGRSATNLCDTSGFRRKSVMARRSQAPISS